MAADMLNAAEDAGWKDAYGEAEDFAGQSAAIITQAAESIDELTQPWAS